MPIFDQGYQHWEGTLTGPALRWWAISRRGFKAGLKNKWARATVFFAFTPALFLVTALALWGLLEQKTASVQAFLQFLNLPREITDDPSKYRVMIWTLLFDYFFQLELFFAVILIATVGPDLISQDLRFNAIPLYFSKPVRRIDYFLGKLGVIGVLLAAVMIAPVVVAYGTGLLFSLDYRVVRDTGRLFLGSLAFGLIVVVSAGTLMLAISSMSRNSRIVGGIWIGFVMVSFNLANALEHNIRQPWCGLLSYPGNLYRVQRGMLNTSGAWQTVMDIQDALINKAETTAKDMGPAAAMAARAARQKAADSGFVPPHPPHPPPDVARFRADRESRRRERRKTWLESKATETLPLWQAVGVLGGLFGCSVLVLTQRVKSLDKLK